MKTKSFRFLITCILTLLLLCFTQQAVFAEDNSATTIRLVRYEGSVEVEGSGGDPKAILENMRFADGDALRTGLESTASVSLDTGRILTVAPSSRVAFSQQGQKLKLTLTEGELFLDVKEKLSEEETLDIQTSTMAIGIRGTIVYVSDRANQDTTAGRITTFGVLEGAAEISYTDTSGAARSTSVPAGERLILRDADGDGLTDAEPEATVMTAADIAGFVAEQIQKDETVLQRVQNASDVLENTVDKFAADGDWTWNEPVTLIAQSASKLYDGSALTRPSDVLVYGLPSDFSIQTRAGGSQIDAGESSNPVSSYVIFNRNGEDVTGHFTGIRTVAGKLKVDPAPLTIWTGSAEKVYDGTPLTEPETQIRTVPGYEAGDPLWRDTAYVGAAARGYETLYGVCGTTWVHGTNPLTGEIREIELPAGKKMTVYLSDEDGKQSIEFRIEDMAEEEIPEDVLRLYADNPDLLTQACKDTGWDEEIIRRLIDLLPEKEDEDTVEQSDLTIVRSASERLMQDSTNVRIHIDTENTSYNNRALGDKEAHFTGVHIDSSIKITATGSQTDVGQSANTYTIDWGTANPNNYILSEELGTLTVTPAPLTVKTGSAEKKYDGEPLTSEEATLTGLVHGETATITATGTITETGSVPNTYTIDWGKTKSSNYTITEQLGTLTVTDADAPVYEDPVTLTAASSEKTYDGTPLTASTVTISGLPEGFTVQATATGSQTDAGSSTSSVTSFTILDADGNDVTAQFVNVTVVNGTLTVTPAALTITTNTDEKVYDGTPLTGTVTFDGLVNGETVTAAAASITDAGTANNTYTIDWGTTNSANYTVTEELGTLAVTQAALTITTSSEEKVYDGTPLTGTVSSEGLASTDTVTLTATGTVTDAGTASNTYTIDWGTTNKDNYTVTENLGTLTVTPLPVVFDLCCSFMEGVEYSGHPIIPEGIRGTYPDTGDEVEIDEAWEYTLDDAEYYTACTYTANLIGGAKAKITVNGNTDAGSYTIDPACTFAEGKEVNYSISYTNNMLKIEPAPLTIKTSSAEKAYDGTPLKGTVSSIDGLADTDKDTVTVTATGSITDAGTDSSTYSIDWGTANEGNYKVTEELGTLTVTPRKAMFNLGGKSVTYYGGYVLPDNPTGTFEGGGNIDWTSSEGDFDGDTLVGKSITYKLVGNDQVQLKYNGYKDAATYTITPEVTFPAGNKDNYELSWTNNTLKIDKRPVTISTPSVEKVYDGTPLSNADMEVTITGLVSGDTVTAAIDPISITDAGTVSNAYTIDWGTINKDNYAVTESPGDLTIKQVQLTLISQCEFDFETHKVSKVAMEIQSSNAAGKYAVSGPNEDNEWTITWTWGDQIVVWNSFAPYPDKATATSYEFTPITISFTGNRDNYDITYVPSSGSINSKAGAPIDSDAVDSPDATDIASKSLSLTKQSLQKPAGENETSEPAGKDPSGKTTETAKESTPADDPEKEENTEEAVKSAEENEGGTKSGDEKSEENEASANTGVEADEKDQPDKEESTDSKEKTDAESEKAENDKDKTTEDKESAEKPTETNDPTDENKPDPGTAADSTSEEKNAEQEKNIGQAIADAGAQAGTAVVQAVESAGASVAPANPETGDSKHPETGAPESPAALIPQGS